MLNSAQYFTILLAFQLVTFVTEANGFEKSQISKLLKAGDYDDLMRKMSVFHNVLTKVHVCYNRYLRCSKKLSADLCASPTKRMAFYFWARRLANRLMNRRDKYNITCSPYFIREVVHGSLSPFVKFKIRLPTK